MRTRNKNRFKKKRAGSINFQELVELYNKRRFLHLITGNEPIDVADIYQGTVLESFLNQYREKVLFPYEFPFLYIITFWGTLLAKKGIVLNTADGRVYKSNVWNLLLAGSGSGKSTMYSLLRQYVFSYFDLHIISLNSTGAAFVSNLSRHPKGLLVTDEIAEIFNDINADHNKRELKKYLLLLYTGDVIENYTKKDGEVRIENPLYGFLGITVKEAFLSNIRPEWLVDGFLARINYFVVGKNYLKRFQDMAPLQFEKSSNTLLKFDDVRNTLLKTYDEVKQNYFLDSEKYAELLAPILKEFQELTEKDENLFPFIIRFTDTVKKYMLIFQTLADPDHEIITEKTMIKSLLMGKKHLQDLLEVVDGVTLNSFDRKIERIYELKERFGRLPTTREIMRHIRVNTAQEATALIKFVESLKREHDEVSTL